MEISQDFINHNKHKIEGDFYVTGNLKKGGVRLAPWISNMLLLLANRTVRQGPPIHSGLAKPNEEAGLV